MGFKTGAYARVWEVSPESDTRTKLRISTSKKNKQTGEYEQDYSGFVMVVGTAAAARALKLKRGDKIRLGDVEVTTRYVKERNTTYTNFTVYTFELEGEQAAEKLSKVSVEEENDPSDNLPF